MAKKEDFNGEEWNLLRAAPILVMTGVAASDPGGLVGAFKEAYSGVNSMMEASYLRACSTTASSKPWGSPAPPP